MDNSEQQVDAAYRWILGRPADPAGLEHYADALRQNLIGPDDLRSVLVASPEHRGDIDRHRLVDIGQDLWVVVDPLDTEFGAVIAASGSWEPHIMAMIRDALSAGDVYVDVGANVGVMAMTAARAVGPTGKVIGFEPNAANVDRFLRGVIHNRFEHVVLYPLALGNAFQVVAMNHASNGKVVASSSTLDIETTAQAVPLDVILANEARLDFLKIDIEGYELHALSGGESVLRRCRPTVLCEFNPLCLMAQGRDEPQRLADFIFSMTDQVAAIEHFGAETVLKDAGSLMSFWDQKDRESSAAGNLQPGWLHLDLRFKVS